VVLGKNVYRLCESWETYSHYAVATGTSRKVILSLKPLPVSRVFQIVGVNIMELLKTSSGDRYMVVFQDFLLKWPMAFPAADQKTTYHLG